MTDLQTSATPEIAAFDQLKDKIANRTAIVGVIGLGYVGLPLIDAFTSASFRVLGFDVDQIKVDTLMHGQSYINHIEPEIVSNWLAQNRFEATTSMNRLDEPDVILICVPTPLSPSRDPDLQYIESTCKSIAQTLREGQLIVLESTTYPGTTRDVMLPLLNQSALVAGRDYFVAYSPEREDPGNPKFTARSIPKVVGGINAASLSLATAFYEAAIAEVVPVSSCEVAEACKILENTYRSVNIAMVNELKVLFDQLGIDVWEVIDAAKTKPFGFQAFYPGPGLGGHCIPIDPFYLSWLARRHELSTRFIELAGEINSNMPYYVVRRLAEALNEHGKPIKQSRIGLLGVAYKRDVDDPRESPAFKLMELLQEQGAQLSYSDPHIPTLPAMRSFEVPPLSSQPLTPEYLQSLDCTLIVTDHSAFDWHLVVQHSQLIVDTRNATARIPGAREKVWPA